MPYPVSKRWENFIRRGYTPVTYIDVRKPGEGVIFSNLPVSDGSVSFDRGRSYRANGSLTVPVPDLFPAINDDSVVSPFGAEIVIRTGIRYPEGTEELIPLGIFPIEEVTGSEADGNVSDIEFYDRAKRVESNDHVAPKDFGGRFVLDVIEEQVLYAAPFYPGDEVEWGVHLDPSLDNIILPAGTILENDRWSFITELAESIGAEVFFDRNGDVQVVPVKTFNEDDGTPEADWVVDAGANGILIDLARGVSRDGMYNGIVVVGSADEDRPQPFFFAKDLDQRSRTYFNGPFGKSVLRIEDDKLTTDAQCRKRAYAELRKTTGLQRSIDYDQVANPAMDINDIILIRGLTGDDEVHLLDSFDFDFVDASMSTSTRSIEYIPPEE